MILFIMMGIDLILIAWVTHLWIKRNDVYVGRLVKKIIISLGHQKLCVENLGTGRYEITLYSVRENGEEIVFDRHFIKNENIRRDKSLMEVEDFN
jgi:hypothetical protein